MRGLSAGKRNKLGSFAKPPFCVTRRQKSLRLRARRVLARSFIRSWTRKIRWRGRHVTPAGILQHQAGALVKLINGDAGYRPFRMRW